MVSSTLPRRRLTREPRCGWANLSFWGVLAIWHSTKRSLLLARAVNYPLLGVDIFDPACLMLSDTLVTYPLSPALVASQCFLAVLRLLLRRLPTSRPSIYFLTFKGRRSAWSITLCSLCPRFFFTLCCQCSSCAARRVYHRSSWSSSLILLNEIEPHSRVSSLRFPSCVYIHSQERLFYTLYFFPSYCIAWATLSSEEQLPSSPRLLISK